jgi:HlyD family secretion protein
MQVTASVDEADIGQVKVGQQVTFRVDAYADDEFDGTVSQIRLAPVIAQNVVTYNVIIDVDNPEQKLMPGMTATCSIQVARRDNVLRVPLGALRFTPADWKGGTDRTTTVASVDGAPSGNGQPRAEGMSRQGGPGGGDRRMMHRPDSTSGHTSNGLIPARLWLMENGALKPLRVLRGLQNQRYAEIINDSIKEGDSVIVGTNSVQAQTAPTGQNPFIPRMLGGGGQRGGR